MNLNQNQRAFLNAMISSQTIEEAARKAGIAKSTGYKYLNDGDFNKALRNERRKITDTLTNQLLDLGTQAIKTLKENLHDPDATPATKNASVKIILEYIYKSYEQEQIKDEIEEIKRLLDL